jgi:hypothetical protein
LGSFGRFCFFAVSFYELRFRSLGQPEIGQGVPGSGPAALQTPPPQPGDFAPIDKAIDLVAVMGRQKGGGLGVRKTPAHENRLLLPGGNLK